MLQAGKRKQPWAALFPKANPVGLDLLDKMLTFNPQKRITVTQALEHPYLASLHCEEEEPVCPTHFDFSFEQHPLTKRNLQVLMFEQIAHFYPEAMATEWKHGTYTPLPPVPPLPASHAGATTASGPAATAAAPTMAAPLAAAASMAPSSAAAGSVAPYAASGGVGGVPMLPPAMPAAGVPAYSAVGTGGTAGYYHHQHAVVPGGMPAGVTAGGVPMVAGHAVPAAAHGAAAGGMMPGGPTGSGE